jgi:predicted nucleic acid-binding protein
VILVDTPIWVDHLRRGDPRLADLLEAARVVCHPFVIGELALGYLQRRTEILALLANLPQAVPAAQEEVLRFVEEHSLLGSGLGWVDVHLLCAAARDGVGFWTFDRRLAAAAARLGLAAYDEPPGRATPT